MCHRALGGARLYGSSGRNYTTHCHHSRFARRSTNSPRARAYSAIWTPMCSTQTTGGLSFLRRADIRQEDAPRRGPRPLYKVKNLRQRVMAHFTDHYLPARDMENSQQLTRIAWIQTGGATHSSDGRSSTRDRGRERFVSCRFKAAKVHPGKPYFAHHFRLCRSACVGLKDDHKKRLQQAMPQRRSGHSHSPDQIFHSPS